MGKKSRRRDKRDNKERGPPSAAEDHSDEYLVREIERSDPSYRLFPKLLEVDPELSRIVVKHRFGGTGDGASVKITAALVRQIREARARSGCDAFEREEEIWDARNWMAFDKTDGLALDEYIGAVVGLQFPRMIGNWEIGGGLIGVLKSVDSQYARLSLKTVESWPRVRPHWKRFRRRLCDYCPACAHLTEPRFLVCSGCGRKRYCCEECQRAQWPAHQNDCLKWQKKLILQQKVEAFERFSMGQADADADAPR